VDVFKWLLEKGASWRALKDEDDTVEDLARKPGQEDKREWAVNQGESHAFMMNIGTRHVIHTCHRIRSILWECQGS
jgi:hypothetical protein